MTTRILFTVLTALAAVFSVHVLLALMFTLAAVTCGALLLAIAAVVIESGWQIVPHVKVRAYA